MLTDSITHVLNVTLQYVVVISSILLHERVKQEYMYLRYRHWEMAKHSWQAAIEKHLRVLYQHYRDLRKELGLTQEEFAAKIGVDPRTVQRWESGEVKPQWRHHSTFQELKHGDKSVQHGYGTYAPFPMPTIRIARPQRSAHVPRLLIIWGIVVSLVLAAIVLYLILRFWLHLI